MKKHSILVIGTGSIGERHTRCFLSTGRAQVSICETNDELRAAVASRYEIESDSSSIDEAIRNSFDATIICTPAHLHVPIASQFAKAGVNLLIEKPLGTSLKGIEELQSLIAEKDLVAGVAYVIRLHPGHAAIRRKLEEGAFGKPLQVVIVSGQNFPTYRPAYRETYYTDHATGGGGIQDAITHSLNLGEWYAGPITQLTCDADHLALEGVTVEDTVHILTRHGNVLGCYTMNQFQAHNETTVTVVCERGTLR
ncbi:MAG: Gfo/Idh/MocA family oxidoreductase, partial [Planctomycetota bacterium]|nr:Gfo/Idh/MocA family oxidoreductase [Planctomycetota bacterium]